MNGYEILPHGGDELKSETELKKEKTQLTKEQSLIGHAIGYLSKYPTPPELKEEIKKVRKWLMERDNKIGDNLKEIEEQLKQIRAVK